MEYKGKTYIYGTERKRDFPVRGKTSEVFYIKMKTGISPFIIYKLIFRTTDFTFLFNNKIERIKEEIDKYIIKSRKRKIKRINHLKK